MWFLAALRCAMLIVLSLSASAASSRLIAEERPNIILMMADDQGWGETGYYNHPVLKTPNLDAMADAGLRLDRFYAAAPVCSPTRASVLTGRTNNRTGVESHGFALRRQETTIAQALKSVGYATGHFGKWHLNGMRGPGVPVLATDTHRPDVFGFQEWLSVTNFFDRDPILGRRGTFEEHQGDSSEIVVDEALKFIKAQTASQTPFFTVIWFGTPHSPFRAAPDDMKPFVELENNSMHHYGELVALDRSVGTLRASLRDLGIANNTLFWYCSDNGGLPNINPGTVGNLRGYKGTLYEGGLRVPAIIEWPARIDEPRITDHPACVMDIFPTLVELLQLPVAAMLQPQDGQNIAALFNGEIGGRTKMIPFNCFGETALIDNDWKLLHVGKGKSRKDLQYELYNLRTDPSESENVISSNPEIAERMRSEMDQFRASLSESIAGKDYPEGKVADGEPEPRYWNRLDTYKPYFDQWKERPEYRRWVTRQPDSN